MTKRKYKVPIEGNPLFGLFPIELAENLRSINPWWTGQPIPVLPSYRRWPFEKLKHMITKGITPATVLRGPRRIGKTVLLKQIIQELLNEGVTPNRILYVPFDELETIAGLQEPVLAVARWFEKEILGATFNASAHKGKEAYLFLDEVQNLDDWAPQIKNLVDNHTVRVFITGSSSFRIEAGKDSLAGRITTMNLGPLFLHEIAALRLKTYSKSYWEENGLDILTKMDFWKEAITIGRRDSEIRNKAFQLFSEWGAYPKAHESDGIKWEEFADYLNESIVKRAIQHDLRIGVRGQKRDEKLLEEVFRLCCRYAGQSPGQNLFVPEIQQTLKGNIGWNRILTYLRFLDSTLLIRLVPPLELRLKRKKASAKICLCDHALRASFLQEVIPLDSAGLTANAHLSDLAGHLAESALGYFLTSIPNLELAHFPARGIEPEVDFIITIGTKRIPIEIKYRKHIDSHEDTVGLRAFLEKTVYNAPFGILVTAEDDVSIPDPRIIAISLSSLLWMR